MIPKMKTILQYDMADPENRSRAARFMRQVWLDSDKGTRAWLLHYMQTGETTLPETANE